MEVFRFAKAIFNRLFLPEGKHFVIALNRDGNLLLHDCTSALEGLGVSVYDGGALQLRLVRELHVSRRRDEYILFVMKESFDIMEDIAEDCDFVNFQFRSMFKGYPWDLVKSLSFQKQAWLYEQDGFVDLNAIVRDQILEDRDFGKDNKETAFSELKAEWDSICADIDFNRPTEWMKKAGEIVLSLVEIDKWEEFRSEVEKVNVAFIKFLKGGYMNIVSSTCGTKYPRIVTQVLPFINKQVGKTALVVVDGMNWWQSLLLVRSLEDKLNIRARYDCIYSWLPSVTELSRQAIFRGDVPSVDYSQGPQNEARLWKDFWAGRRVASFEQYYQHSGIISEELSIKRLGYVDVKLDEMMHASQDYRYLYANTKVWVDEDEVIENFKHLLDGGYKVFITTDHGNVDATAYRKLDSRDSLGANLSLRHITLPKEADKRLFETEYAGHIEQVDVSSRTYYAKGKEAFINSGKCVTHGGVHWLEVLIPFITLE